MNGYVGNIVKTNNLKSVLVSCSSKNEKSITYSERIQLDPKPPDYKEHIKVV